MHFRQMDLFQPWGTKGRDVPTQMASRERVILSKWIWNNNKIVLSTKSNQAGTSILSHLKKEKKTDPETM